jgi:hypothetical protein
MKTFITNAGLGYNEYAILLLINQSNVNILKNFINVFKLLNEKQKIINIINNINNSKHFEFYYSIDKNKHIFKYLILDINILINGKGKFVNYLHHDCEIYYNGKEEYTMDCITHEINKLKELQEHSTIINNILIETINV